MLSEPFSAPLLADSVLPCGGRLLCLVYLPNPWFVDCLTVGSTCR